MFRGSRLGNDPFRASFRTNCATIVPVVAKPDLNFELVPLLPLSGKPAGKLQNKLKR